MNIFRKNPPITGGNALETNERLLAQKSIDIANIEALNNSSTALLKTTSEKTGEKFINDKLVDPYFMLQQQANYFANTIDFDVEDPFIQESIFKVIRCAFLYGRAGLYRDKTTNKIFPVALIKSKNNIYGEFDLIEITPIDTYLTSNIQTPKVAKSILLKGVGDCKNYVEFQWGSLGISSWITIFPYVRWEYLLQQMMVGLSFAYIKKFSYRVADPTAISKELEIFFNPANLFLYNSSFSGEIKNKIESLDLPKEDATNFLDYYNGTMNIIYSNIGRRVNIDDKKERNVSDEIKASQENYDMLKKEYYKYFELFVKKVFKQFGIIITLEKDKTQQEESREYEESE